MFYMKYAGITSNKMSGLMAQISTLRGNVCITAYKANRLAHDINNYVGSRQF